MVKSNLITTFPSSFESKAQSMGIFASDEYTKRDPAFWVTYRDRIQAVTAAEVQRVAREHLVPEKLVAAGGGRPGRDRQGRRGARRGARQARPGGKDVTLALRDPLTMKRP